MVHFTISGTGHLTFTSTGHITVQEPVVEGGVRGGSGGELSGSSTVPGSTPSWNQPFAHRTGFAATSGYDATGVLSLAQGGNAGPYMADKQWGSSEYTSADSYLIMDQYHLGAERKPGTDDWYHLSRDCYMYLLGLAEFADTPMINIPSVES